MAGARQIKIDLDEDQYDAVVAAVESGEYASTDDVIVEALAEWRENRHAVEIDTETLRRLCEEGLASGPSVPFDPEEIKRKAREEFYAKR